jgi:hypothetical protein
VKDKHFRDHLSPKQWTFVPNCCKSDKKERHGFQMTLLLLQIDAAGHLRKLSLLVTVEALSIPNFKKISLTLWAV